jgi:sugar/nucleoside kinase (ribokinase family)
MGAGPRILVVGAVIDDVLVRPAGPIRPDTDTVATIERRPGGSAANVAAWLGFLGASVDFVGTVHASDRDRHAGLLEAVGVTTLLLPSAEPTGTIVLLLEGEVRTMLTARGANDLTRPESVPAGLLRAAGHVHLTGYSLFASDPQGWRRLLAGAAPATSSVDPSSTAFLEEFGVDRFLATTAGVDMAFPNLDEGRLLTGGSTPDDVAAALLEHYPVVALTLGPDGVLVRTRSGPVLRLPAVRPEGGALDPTGAGDAFAAGFLERWCAGAPLADAATAGVTTASRAVAMVGARPAPAVAQ